jgi:ABC-type multidrug transport system ATPase subunit
MPTGGEFEAVHEVAFDVAAKECFGLLGPNGAGKSTTIQCITGFYPPTKGQVLIAGRPCQAETRASGLRRLQSRRHARQRLQRPQPADPSCRVFSHRRADGAKASAGTARRFGLTDKATQMIESLSGGLRRRLQVARALISEPKVLVLDEPTTGLDPDARRELWEVLTEAREQGTAILLSTHYMDEAERLCDRIAILHKGRILDIDSPERLIKNHIARGEVEEEVRPGVIWKRKPNLEDVYLKLTGSRLGVEGL